MKNPIFDIQLNGNTRTLTVHGNLSEREIQVLELAANGESLKSIAALLHVSTSTADTHSRSVIKKLAAKNMKHAIAIGLRKKIIQ